MKKREQQIIGKSVEPKKPAGRTLAEHLNIDPENWPGRETGKQAQEVRETRSVTDRRIEAAGVRISKEKDPVLRRLLRKAFYGD